MGMGTNSTENTSEIEIMSWNCVRFSDYQQKRKTHKLPEASIFFFLSAKSAISNKNSEFPSNQTVLGAPACPVFIYTKFSKFCLMSDEIGLLSLCNCAKMTIHFIYESLVSTCTYRP